MAYTPDGSNPINYVPTDPSVEIFIIEQGTNRRLELIENFENFIWTERYNVYGDFELYAESTEKNIEKLVPGQWLGFNQSDRIMIIKKVFRETADDGHKRLKVEGKSLESIFQDRAAILSLASAKNGWTLWGDSIGHCAALVVNTTCIQGASSYKDVIFGLTIGGYPSGAALNITIKPGTVYDRVKEICDTGNLGFKITYAPQEGVPPQISGVVIYDAPLIFTVYAGADRSDWGSDSVIFSEDSDSLFNSSELKSEESFKNVAYVYSNTQSTIVDEIDPASLHPGFTRKVLLVDATDITTTGTAGTNMLIQRGREALTNNKKLSLVDGKINPDGIFQYKQHYLLGDIVLIKSDDGATSQARVTEHIWTYDAEGLNGYPTLTAIV